MSEPTTFVEAEENLAAALPNYESRPQQVELATAVERSIATGTHLLGEAGTGTGKSLGYLIPAILSGRKVVVSTATKALQDQIAAKDLPFLAEHLGKPFTFTLLKGRSNYLCVNKASTLDPAEVPSLGQILAVAEKRATDPTFTGERDQLGLDLSDREWIQVAADTDDCAAFGCKETGVCYGTIARQRAQNADVVVVNHALYMTDIKAFRSLIGHHEVAVFDEAHEMEEYASSAFGTTLRRGAVNGLCTEVRNFTRRHYPEAVATACEHLTAEVLTAAATFWDVLEEGRIRQADVLDHGDIYVNFANALKDLADRVGALRVREMDPERVPEKASAKIERLKSRANNLANDFYAIIATSFDEMVRWVERDRKDEWMLRTAPIDVAPILRRNLFDVDPTCRRCDGSGQYLGDGVCFSCDGSGQVANGPTCVLVSATLSVGGKFAYIAGRLGIDRYDELDVGTPFTYGEQALLYVPKHLPDPSRERAAWSSMAITEMLDLVKASQGRALILFTSISEMRNAYDTLSARLPYTCLMQGQKPNKVLADEFAADTHSVLFATRSFMTGFDVQGESLSLVVINKLPFPVPTEPVTEARCEAIKRRGGNDFSSFVVPTMTLILKQAFGRLIRHRNDRGVVAILDPRLQTKGYGRGIIRSLPDAPLTSEFGAVEAFFVALEAERAKV